MLEILREIKRIYVMYKFYDEQNRFEHLTERQKDACYFIMNTLRIYLKKNQTPEQFLTKYLAKAKIKAGWGDPNKRAVYYLDRFPNEMYR
jgi:hypothetical protein